MYIHLSSNDSKAVFPDNNSSEFIVELKSTIRGNYAVALVDFYCATVPETLYIFCDIITPSFLRGDDAPILRIVHNSGEPRNLHYFPVSRRDIQRIKIVILDANMQKLPLAEVSCTLHLKAI